MKPLAHPTPGDHAGIAQMTLTEIAGEISHALHRMRRFMHAAAFRAGSRALVWYEGRYKEGARGWEECKPDSSLTRTEAAKYLAYLRSGFAGTWSELCRLLEEAETGQQ